MEKKQLTYAGAGHPPLLFWSKSAGKVSEVLENGIVLGMVEEAEYASLQLPIAAGDRGVLYTDGIPEAKSPEDEEFGTERFTKFMTANHSLPVDGFADALIDELFRWSGQPRGQGQQDDITVLTFD